MPTTHVRVVQMNTRIRDCQTLDALKIFLIRSLRVLIRNSDLKLISSDEFLTNFIENCQKITTEEKITSELRFDSGIEVI